MSSVLQAANRWSEVSLPMETAMRLSPCRVALAERQLPAPSVVPVFSPVQPS